MDNPAADTSNTLAPAVEKKIADLGACAVSGALINENFFSTQNKLLDYASSSDQRNDGLFLDYLLSLRMCAVMFDSDQWIYSIKILKAKHYSQADSERNTGYYRLGTTLSCVVYFPL